MRRQMRSLSLLARGTELTPPVLIRPAFSCFPPPEGTRYAETDSVWQTRRLRPTIEVVNVALEFGLDNIGHSELGRPGRAFRTQNDPCSTVGQTVQVATVKAEQGPNPLPPPP